MLSVWGIFGGISGVLITALFMGTAIYVKRVPKGKGKSKFDTISDFGKIPHMGKRIFLACLLISLINLPFMAGLYNTLIPATNLIPLAIGLSASFFLILTGYSAKQPDSKTHKRWAILFFSLLFLDGFVISLSVLKVLPFFGLVGLVLTLLSAIMGIYILFMKHKMGTAELIYLALNSIWIILFSMLMFRA